MVLLPLSRNGGPRCILIKQRSELSGDKLTEIDCTKNGPHLGPISKPHVTQANVLTTAPSCEKISASPGFEPTTFWVPALQTRTKSIVISSYILQVELHRTILVNYVTKSHNDSRLFISKLASTEKWRFPQELQNRQFFEKIVAHPFFNFHKK